mgnify:CR=1 FL=1
MHGRIKPQDILDTLWSFLEQSWFKLNGIFPREALTMLTFIFIKMVMNVLSAVELTVKSL